jgi:hypothetical protein
MLLKERGFEKRWMTMRAMFDGLGVISGGPHLRRVLVDPQRRRRYLAGGSLITSTRPRSEHALPTGSMLTQTSGLSSSIQQLMSACCQ